jgi:cobalt-zinc-cadmium efflux system membrane fusion protein
MAKKVGINTATVKGEVLHQTITSYGVLATGSEQLSHMRARFSGLVTSVDASIGDEVQAGDSLAQIESDQSLKQYSVRAPISGTVVQRHANKGEVTKDQVLFSIANFDTLWAEFRIYPAQRDKVSAGQGVEIVSGDKKIIGKISHIIPALDRPFQLARVELDNEQLALSPGLLIEGRIVVAKVSVDLAVEKSGVQKIGGRSGVFVKTKEAYRFTPLILGRADDNYVEVLDGLDRGQRYVNQNSYLIKADIEKSEAEHDH